MGGKATDSQAKSAWRHHTVPKVLLKSFAHDDKKKIWAWIQASRKVVELSIDDASVQKGFNAKEDGSTELESFFANEVEGPFGEILQAGALATPGQILRAPVKRVVSLFFSSQFLRVGGARAAMQRRNSAFIEENVGAQHARLKKAAKEMGERYDRRERREFEEQLRARASSPDYHIEFTREMILKHSGALERCKWDVVQIPLGEELVLSDVPAKSLQIAETGAFRVLDFQGVGRADTTLFMPINPHLALVCTKLGQVPPLPRWGASVLNDVVAKDSTQVYARSKELLVRFGGSSR